MLRRTFLLFGFVLVGCLFVPGSLQAQDKKPRREGTVLYKPKAGASKSQKAALAKVEAKHGLAAQRKLVGGSVTQGKAGQMQAADEEALAAELLATGAVEFAEPDYMAAPVLLPNDPSFSSQWWQSKIQSAGGWDVTTGSASIKVAVCDTGVDSDHPDLVANLISPGFNVADSPVTNNSEDQHNHGTWVAGCIGAVGNNGVGVVGVNWTVRILPIRITNDPAGYAYYSDMSEAVQLAANQGCKVANLSYGGASSSTIDSAGQYIRSKGGLLFMSAGNDSNDGDSGTIYLDFTSFVQVGATTSSDTRASWSNYGSYIDVVAPGVSILSTARGGGYSSPSGTSFSSPITAGLGALLWSINPGFTPTQVENFIFNGADDVGDPGEDRIYGHGRINVSNSVALAYASVGNLAPSISSGPWADPNPVKLPSSTTVSVIASDPDNGPLALKYTWSKVSGPGTVSFSPNGTTGSAISTATFSAAGAYVLRVSVSDGTATVTSDTDVTVQPDNYVPTASISANPTSGFAPLAVNFSGAGSSDADGTIASYAWTFGDGGTSSGVSVSHTYTGIGTFTARLTVTDNKGATGTATVSISVADPNVINAPSNLTGSVSGSTVTLNWTDNSGNETGFQIDRGVKLRKTTTWTNNVATVGANVTSFSQTVSNGTYLYRVRAVNSSTGKVSSNSNEVQVKVGTTKGGGSGGGG
ncbi:MAG: S8 family serine peptidase [Planctomycetes bacterium]|nr:S8 family serine peptidase [Planctomycetota bacterium]